MNNTTLAVARILGDGVRQRTRGLAAAPPFIPPAGVYASDISRAAGAPGEGEPPPIARCIASAVALIG
jgi:hypothetical protein